MSMLSNETLFFFRFIAAQIHSLAHSYRTKVTSTILHKYFFFSVVGCVSALVCKQLFVTLVVIN